MEVTQRIPSTGTRVRILPERDRDGKRIAASNDDPRRRVDWFVVRQQDDDPDLLTVCHGAMLWTIDDWPDRVHIVTA